MANEKVLVVDDEKNIVELVKFNLEKEGFEVLCAYNGDEAIEITRKEKPDLIILDIMMPGKSGLDVCRILRSETKVPIIMATAKGEEVDKILGLELGSDDYVTKPFSPRELISRVKAILRRTTDKVVIENLLTFGDLAIDLIKREVLLKNKTLNLKPKEFDLLKILATNQGKVFTRDFLLEQLWGYDYLGDTRTVDVHMRRLRQKLEKNPAKPLYLKTIHGIGYKFHYGETE